MEMSEVERQYSALNTIKDILVMRRWMLKTDNVEYDKLPESKDDELNIVTIKCTNTLNVAIKFYNKLNTIKNDKEIETFLQQYNQYHRIIICNEINSKAEKQIMDTKMLEYFKMMEVIVNLSKHHLIPEHILLTEEEKERVMKEYDLKYKDMGRIFYNDMMARYLYAQNKDVVKIIRKSINAGYSTYYRLVVNNSIHN